MTRRTLKGGIAKFIAKGTVGVGSKIFKKSEKLFIGDNATRKMYAAAMQAKTFMGQNMMVHRFALKTLASNVFKFAKKYEKYSKTCIQKNPICLTKEEIEEDRNDMIEQIANDLPETYDEQYVKDPRRGIIQTGVTNWAKVYRKDDLKFLYRLKLMLDKWKEFYSDTNEPSEPNEPNEANEADEANEPTKTNVYKEKYDKIQNTLKDYYPYIEGVDIDNKIPYGVGYVYYNYFKFADKNDKRMVYSSFRYDKLTKKEIKDEFDKRYKEQYLLVVKKANTIVEPSPVISTPSETLLSAEAPVQGPVVQGTVLQGPVVQGTVLQGPAGAPVQGLTGAPVQGLTGAPVQCPAVQETVLSGSLLLEAIEKNEYVKGLEEATDKTTKEGTYKGKKYTLKRKGNVISIEPNEP